MQWEPTREGYLQFLVESREVYSALEEIVSSTDRNDGAQYTRHRRAATRSLICALANGGFVRLAVAEFRNTGLERSAALEKDIAWFKEVYGLEPPKVTDDGPGRTYARFAIQDISCSLVCSWSVNRFLNLQADAPACGRGRPGLPLPLLQLLLCTYRWWAHDWHQGNSCWTCLVFPPSRS